jgi:nicotinamidase-related amidase
MPLDNEPVVVKQHANSFRDTSLKKILDDKGAESVIIAGAMSNMCIDAVTRAASDLGYHCAVAHDACAAMDLGFGDTAVPAQQVHAAFMAALGLGYARVASSDELLGDDNLS